MLNESVIEQLRGATVTAGSDDVGEVVDVYTHAWEDRPAVVSVQAGDRTVLVPLPDGEESIEDGAVSVPFDADTVQDAPEAGADELTEADFEAVYDHYGISDATMREDSGTLGTHGAGGADPRTDSAADDGQQGHP